MMVAGGDYLTRVSRDDEARRSRLHRAPAEAAAASQPRELSAKPPLTAQLNSVKLS